jgi:nucleoside-diphosphate-sugar epimerase
MPNIFVTGGLGYIGERRTGCVHWPGAMVGPLSTVICVAGSHTVLVLLEAGHTVTIIDNLSNSYTRVFEHMKKLAGDKAGNMKFVKVGPASTQPVPHIRLQVCHAVCRYIHQTRLTADSSVSVSAWLICITV